MPLVDDDDDDEEIHVKPSASKSKIRTRFAFDDISIRNTHGESYEGRQSVEHSITPQIQSDDLIIILLFF